AGSNNTVGGTTAAARNILSGNNRAGIFVSGSSPTFIQGNYIGTTASGLAALRNASFGVLGGDTRNTPIGGTTARARNVHVGAIELEGNLTNGVTIQGNYVGTDATGTAALDTVLEAGVYVTNGVANTLIGGTATGAGNLISGNDFGILVDSTGSGTLIQGN